MDAVGAGPGPLAATTDVIAAAAPPVPRTRQAQVAQVYAWGRYGGAQLAVGLPDAMEEIPEGLQRMGNGDRSGTGPVRSGCAAVAAPARCPR